MSVSYISFLFQFLISVSYFSKLIKAQKNRDME